ncbi:methionine biosynthesis protein MetW [Pelagibacterales bacterium SAG-MED38]|jgi:methionine biosynthesis protein MetW|nr:methionine biosynthesis protein MetW [Pelagibacterales bacterium SAG-MED38]MBD1141695.1 methionine biosynthesis protein MetW [Pelagibacterales bacterium SAG-MED32]|tara:strand:- start:419 stop:1036 length:618 start_codon:yes stop_codon:yes gene_type:complete
MSLINEKKDFKIIADLIPANSSVIDVGCNDGSLLEFLKEEKDINGRGMEIDQQKVQLCLSKGISVIEGDADLDLYDYPDNLFDYSILTYTLQATKSPKNVLSELVRISSKAIISFPNFGHWKIATSLLIKRKMPISEKLSYSWHETPNLHFCTINDFIDLCEEAGIRIEKQANLKTNRLNKFYGKNLLNSYFNEVGLFLVSKIKN